MEPEHLVAEQEEGMVGALPDDVHPQLVDEEVAGLHAVPKPQVDVVEPGEPKVLRQRCHEIYRPANAVGLREVRLLFGPAEGGSK